MKPITFLLAFQVVMLIVHAAWSQKYKSTASSVHFFSKAPMENIEANNSEAGSAFDLSSGDIVFSIPINAFTFEKSLMQKHFNENYLESEIFPTASFTGKITDFDRNVAGWQPARATGKMTIHGVENVFTCDGKINILSTGVDIEAVFPIALKDYKIKIPKVVFYNIAEVVEVTIKFSYEKIN
jgi:hypothetical protein